MPAREGRGARGQAEGRWEPRGLCSGTPLTLVAGELGRSTGQTNRGNGLLAHYCLSVKGSGREQGREVCTVLVFDRRNNFRETFLPAAVELDLTKQGSWGKGRS